MWLQHKKFRTSARRACRIELAAGLLNEGAYDRRDATAGTRQARRSPQTRIRSIGPGCTRR